MIETIQRLIDEKAELPILARDLPLNSDLYRAGLTSFTAIKLMLALEQEFEVEFPDRMLNRQSMSSINAIQSCICECRKGKRQKAA